LEEKVGMVRAARAQADDGHATVVHQVFLTPERMLTRAEDTRVESHFSLVFGNGDIGPEDAADSADEGFAHGLDLSAHYLREVT
jgi:hypothetical protein